MILAKTGEQGITYIRLPGSMVADALYVPMPVFGIAHLFAGAQTVTRDTPKRAS